MICKSIIQYFKLLSDKLSLELVTNRDQFLIFYMAAVTFFVLIFCASNSISLLNFASITLAYARVSPKKLFEDMDKFIEATQDFKLTL